MLLWKDFGLLCSKKTIVSFLTEPSILQQRSYEQFNLMHNKKLKKSETTIYCLVERIQQSMKYSRSEADKTSYSEIFFISIEKLRASSRLDLEVSEMNTVYK